MQSLGRKMWTIKGLRVEKDGIPEECEPLLNKLCGNSLDEIGRDRINYQEESGRWNHMVLKMSIVCRFKGQGDLLQYVHIELTLSKMTLCKN